MKTGTELIKEERKRQIDVEGYNSTHDGFHKPEEFIRAAASYLLCNLEEYEEVPWPWGIESWNPKDLERNLIRAGALIAAALDRIQNNK